MCAKISFGKNYDDKTLEKLQQTIDKVNKSPNITDSNKQIIESDIRIIHFYECPDSAAPFNSDFEVLKKHIELLDNSENQGIEIFFDKIIKYKPTLLHIHAHGKIEGLLFCEANNNRKEHLFTIDVLFDKINNYATTINTIVLNGCNTENIANELIKIEHIRFVICTNKSIEHSKTVDFSRLFYKYLSLNKSIEKSFDSFLKDSPEPYKIKKKNHS